MKLLGLKVFGTGFGAMDMQNTSNAHMTENPIGRYRRPTASVIT
jgi:hypothetical protein